MKNLFTVLVTLISFCFMTLPTTAGIYSDELAKCTVEKTTEQDKINLIKWMFTAITLHPAISSLVPITKAKRDLNNRNIAKMLEKLLISTCRNETVNAVKYEGDVAIAAAFQVLGEVAARELFAHPAVTAGMAELDKYIDNEKIKEVYGVKE